MYIYIYLYTYINKFLHTEIYLLQWEGLFELSRGNDRNYRGDRDHAYMYISFYTDIKTYIRTDTTLCSGKVCVNFREETTIIIEGIEIMCMCVYIYIYIYRNIHT